MEKILAVLSIQIILITVYKMFIRDVVLLIQSDFTQEQTSFFDASQNQHTVTPVGDVRHVSDLEAFSGTFIYFDGDGDYLSIPDSPQFFLGDGAYTIAFQIKRDEISCREMVFGQGNGAPGGIAIRMEIGSNDTVYIYRNNVNFDTGIQLGDLALHHLAFVDDGVNFVPYIDGTAGNIGGHIAILDSNEPLLIGDQTTGGTLNFKGKIGEFIISDSVIWTGSFDPPTTPYTLQEIFLYHEQKISILMQHQHTQLLSMAPRLYHQVTQILATARRLNLAHDQLFDTAIPMHLQHEQVFHGMTQVALAFSQVFRGYGPAVALEFIQSWASHDYNLAFLPFVQLIGSQIGTVLQEIQFSVTIAGVRVGVTDCQFDRDDFCQIATLTLADKRDYDNKEHFDNVVITVCGEQFRLIVVDKPYDEQIQQGRIEHGYIIECASITCQLSESINDNVRATRITASFPAGTMASEILAALTDGICSASLNVTDFQAGGYDFEDAGRIDALRQLFPDGGDYPWIIETDGDGVLQISSWTMPDFGVPGKKTLQLKQKQLTPTEGILYTQVSIKNYNQGDGQTGLTLEVVDNGDGTGTISGS